MSIRRGRSVLLAGVLLAVAVPAQGTWEFENSTHGLRMRLPRWLDAVPAKPGDEQTLALFKGSTRARDDRWGKEPELTLVVVRIVKRSGPTTGEAEETEEEREERMRSLTEQRVEYLNSGRTLKEYLELRGERSNIWPDDKLLRKPATDADGREYATHVIHSPRGIKYGHDLRAFVAEDDNEIFAVLASGPGCNAHFNDVVKVLKSLERTAATAAASGEDPYAGTTYRDVERRRKLRSELVPGWQAHDSENFVLVTNVTSKRLIERLLTDLEVMRAAYMERFPPADGADMTPVSCVRVCDGYEDYLRYAGKDMDGTGGYWNFIEEELVLFNPERRIPKARPWLGAVEPERVLYHEAMHQYLHYSNRALAPASWFNEGYGEYFGGAEIKRRKGEVSGIGRNRIRLDLIRLCRKQKRTPPTLHQMLRMTQHEFYSNAPLENYAYSWAFCYFLEDQRAKSDRSRSKVEEWAALPDRYLEELRKATEAAREALPPDAPEDWIVAFAYDIQKTAIEKALEGLDVDALQEAFYRFLERL